MADTRILYTALLDGEGDDPQKQVTVDLAAEGLKILAPHGVPIDLWTYGDLLSAARQPASGFSVVRRSNPRRRLTILDKDFRRVAAIKAPALGPMDGCGRYIPALMVAGLVLLIGLGAAGWWAASSALSWFRETMPVIADRIMAPVWNAALPLCQARDADAALQNLAGKIARANGLKTVPGISIVDLPDINAVSTPGGDHIFVTRGLIDSLKSPHELTGVLAHQLGHTANGHRISIDVHGRMDHSRANTTMVVGCHTGAEELEADGWALAAQERAGLQSDGMKDLLERIPPFDSRTWGSFTCTHPVSDARLTLMDMASETATGTSTGLSPSEWDAVRGACLAGT